MLQRHAELMVLRLLYSVRVIRTRKFLKVCDEPVRVLTDGRWPEAMGGGNRLGSTIDDRLGLIIGSVTDSRNPGKKRGRELPPPTPVVLADGYFAALELSCYRVRDVVGNPAEVVRYLLAQDGQDRLALFVAHLAGSVDFRGYDDFILCELNVEPGSWEEPVLRELVLMG